MFESIREPHLQMLREGSGISDKVIAARGYRSISANEAKEYGFAPSQRRSGLLMPVWSPDGVNPLHILRPDSPRLNGDKPLKYEMPQGQSVRLDCPPLCRAMLADPNIPLWVTEGIKKADALASHDLCAIALLGVWNFKGKNDLGGVTFLSDWDFIALNGRQVNIVFDSDVMTKHQVREALDRLTEHLQRKGAHVAAVYLPSENGSKVGVDDYLLKHSVTDLEGLAEGPRPQPKAAQPLIELLDNPPAKLTQALQLVDGRGYAVAWLWVKRTVTEKMDTKTGNIIKYDPPIEETRRHQFVIRDDGVIFGEGGDKPVEELGLDVSLPMPPKDSKLWTSKGVKAYKAGYRPEPCDVFQRLVSLIDRFMSFDRSLAEPSAMCELLACYTLSTWLRDAFDVIGFLWPNGTHGTGKTKLGLLVCEVAYLGEVLLSGSTLACLRDLADLGATLLFDDVEDLSDPKKTDPDKRSLLLAGNRRGASIAVKELGADKTWRTRFVNAYCPRLFTAINLPDPVLASRTIVIPLVRATDAKKANSEVLDYAQWSCDQRQLLDDLWALALGNISAIPAHNAAVGQDAPLVGRNLEPWRAILGVAHWLDGLGKAGLYDRMCNLAKTYQTERSELETIDLTKLVIRAMISLLAPSAPSAPNAPVVLGASEIADKVNSIAKEDDLTAVSATPQSVGKVLTALRLQNMSKTSGASRKRKTTAAQLDAIARSYGLPPVITDNGTPQEEPGLLGQMGQMGRPDNLVATGKATAEVDL